MPPRIRHWQRQKGGRSSLYSKVSVPSYLRLPLQGLNLAAKEIPVGGEALALIEVILSNARFIVKFMKLIRGSQVLKNLIQINFQQGPKGVQKQFARLWRLIPPNEYKYYCETVPQIYADLQTAICDWIETVPVAGPPASLLIKTAGGFDLMNSIYAGLPVETRELFENPDSLNGMVGQAIEAIKEALNAEDKNKPKQGATKSGKTKQAKTKQRRTTQGKSNQRGKRVLRGGSFLSDMKKKISQARNSEFLTKMKKAATKLGEKAVTLGTKIASSKILADVKKNLAVLKTEAKAVTGPIMAGLAVVGADEYVKKKIDVYLNKVLQPATKGAGKSIQIIFPLYFSLLCLVDKCKMIDQQRGKTGKTGKRGQRGKTGKRG